MAEREDQQSNDKGIGEGQLRNMENREAPPNAAPGYAGDDPPQSEGQGGTAGGAGVSQQGGGVGTSKQGGNTGSGSSGSR